MTGRRAVALWLALLALTIQAFSPLAHARALQRFAADPGSGYVVICAPDGLKLIDLDAMVAADARDGKAVGFHLPFDVNAKAGKFACCLAAAVPAVAPDLPTLLAPPRVATATAPPLTASPHHVRGLPPDRPGHPRGPPV
ncbi:DUF2946 family protein [Reyranella sp. CPCC 100927]|uniref:DUF2946 family protein n=1 Tax=Reyranella sp. CPCC 100927 TaxID=2599616 RepID=UPI0011B82856|nr:DUF2946 family protein [Reyranella sp. CPCC 100927]TWT11819.1 hypothetical protein FQU96_15220 [Reyranella sp. CPCC 100927]